MPKTDPSKRATLRTDFHTHTIYSRDSLTTPARLIAAARRKGIDRVVVSDHNNIQGALRAKELDPERIIVGEEIKTSAGEILAVYVRQEIPPGLTPKETIARLKDQGAFISISHPFDRTRKGAWRTADLLAILADIDAIETFNARCLWPRPNWQAEAFARTHQLPGTHGSDAHATFEIGRGSLLVPYYEDAASLRLSIQKAVSPRLTLSAPWVHLTSRYAVWVKKRKS
ncbi:MAG: PHP domain-containing protein [Anaerolineales bacterium]|nr:PHP domain-containing protein [Anaerolineales bacterium]